MWLQCIHLSEVLMSHTCVCCILYCIVLCCTHTCEQTGVPVTGNPKQDLLLSKGWTVHSTHWQPDGTGSQHNGRFWPFAAVLYKGGDVIVVVRGSQTQQDWKSGAWWCCVQTRVPEA